MKPTRIFGIAVLVLAAAIGTAAVVVDQLRDEPKVTGAMATSSTVEIGGPFTLTDQDGRTVTADDLRGRYLMVYFGYTFCPDVCPTELQDIAGVMDELGAAAEKVTPVFITIDPARDDVERMKGYVEAFHPRMIGLTGDEAAIAAAAKSYRVYYARAPGEDGDYYLMDHSNFIYLMGPDGKNIAIFNGQTPFEKMAAGVREAVEEG